MEIQEEALFGSYKGKLFSESQSAECNGNFFGPALPPHMLRKGLENRKKEQICGPKLPDHFSEKEKEQLTGISLPVLEHEAKILIGPEIPECLKSSESLLELDEKVPTFDKEENFGPSTTLMAAGDVTEYKFKNAERLYKDVLQNSRKLSPKRETWMTELPEKKGANFGLFPRHFKSRIYSDKESDSSVWTDSPVDKKRKDCNTKNKDHKEILQIKRLKERDKEMEKLVIKAAKKLKKKQSLLEMHVESLKEKKKMESKNRKRKGKTLPERRPFDRNVDLQIRKIDENQKRAILNKSQFLNDRFAPGQSKFL